MWLKILNNIKNKTLTKKEKLTNVCRKQMLFYKISHIGLFDISVFKLVLIKIKI